MKTPIYAQDTLDPITDELEMQIAADPDFDKIFWKTEADVIREINQDIMLEKLGIKSRNLTPFENLPDELARLDNDWLEREAQNGRTHHLAYQSN
jgi:hypothetical protein